MERGLNFLLQPEPGHSLSIHPSFFAHPLLEEHAITTQPNTAVPHQSSPGPAGASDAVASWPVLTASSLYSPTKICIENYYLDQPKEKEGEESLKKKKNPHITKNQDTSLPRGSISPPTDKSL